jgi:hypothetical protein
MRAGDTGVACNQRPLADVDSSACDARVPTDCGVLRMSSIMRWRSGLTLGSVEVMMGLLLENEAGLPHSPTYGTA